MMPYASSGQKKENLNEIIFLAGDVTKMTSNFSKESWSRHEVRGSPFHYDYQTMKLKTQCDDIKSNF